MQKKILCLLLATLLALGALGAVAAIHPDDLPEGAGLVVTAGTLRVRQGPTTDSPSSAACTRAICSPCWAAPAIGSGYSPLWARKDTFTRTTWTQLWKKMNRPLPTTALTTTSFCRRRGGV